MRRISAIGFGLALSSGAEAAPAVPVQSAGPVSNLNLEDLPEYKFVRLYSAGLGMGQSEDFKNHPETFFLREIEIEGAADPFNMDYLILEYKGYSTYERSGQIQTVYLGFYDPLGDYRGCVRSTSYEARFEFEGNVYIVVPESPNPGECPNIVHEKIEEKVEQKIEVAEIGRGEKKKRLPVRFGVFGGLDVEEFGPYNQGNSVMFGASGDYTFGQNSLGANANFISGFGDALGRKGLERAGISLSRDIERHRVGLHGGLSFDPEYSSLDNVWYAGVGYDVRVASLGSGDIRCGLNVNRDFYGNGGLWLGGQIECGYEIGPFGGDDFLEPVSTEVGKPKLGTYSSLEYPEVSLKESNKEVSAADKSTYVNASGEMADLLAGGFYDGAERKYQELITLRKKGIEIKFQEYFVGAQIAASRGDIKELYLRLKSAILSTENEEERKSVEAWAEALKNDYGDVDITVDDCSGGESFFPNDGLSMMDPVKRASIENAKSGVSSGRYSGWLPVGEYAFEFPGQNFEVLAGQKLSVKLSCK